MLRKISLLVLMAAGVTIAVAAPRTATSLTTPYEPQPQIEFLTIDQSEVDRLYAEWLKQKELESKAEKLEGKYGGQCVTFARNFVGATRDDVSGVARNVQTNTTTPEVGAIVKTNESRAGHLSVVINIDGEIMTVVDSNYGWDGKIRIRKVSTSDPKILGYKIIN